MKVLEFESWALKDTEHIGHLANIIEAYIAEDNLLIVLPPMYGIEKSLTKIIIDFCAGHKEQALQAFEKIKKQHLDIAKYLLILNFNDCLAKLVDIFTEVEWLLHDKPVHSYSYYYDQIFCVGPLLSSMIFSAYLNEKRLPNVFMDVRDVIRTDNFFMHAEVDYATTIKNANNILAPLLSSKKLVITQAGIGCTDENESTTFGYHCNDYSASVLASVLKAEEVILWRNTEAWMTHHPDKNDHAKALRDITYAQAQMLAKSGSEVAQERTIALMAEKNIPLQILYFYDTGLPGTHIQNKDTDKEPLPPIEVERTSVSLIKAVSEDNESIEDQVKEKVDEIVQEARITPVLLSMGEYEINIGIYSYAEDIENIAQKMGEILRVQVQKDVTLLSFVNTSEAEINRVTMGRKIILKQDLAEVVKIIVA